MSKSKSQWDFGELFPTEATRKVFSVGELTEQIRRLLEKQIGSIWVSGEITNFRSQSSGHIYFTLKDASAQISCVLFRNEIVPHRELIADGQKILLQGDVTVYEARGNYQIIVRAVELQGVGALQIAFEKLKQKLAAEGLFAQERKRPLPKFPQRIGLVTSPTGAAIRDVLHVIQRRNPSLEIILAPCEVQGDGAAKEIADAIRLLNEFSSRSSGRESAQTENQSRLTSAATMELDLILITRGGGSMEDLWAFNEEIVARAIFEAMRRADAAIVPTTIFRQTIFADAKCATIGAGASASEISELDSAIGRFAKRFGALFETAGAAFANRSAESVGAIASHPAFAILETAARSIETNPETIEFTRTRAGFVARLFHHDGRGKRKNNPSREGREGWTKFADAGQRRRDCQQG